VLYSKGEALATIHNKHITSCEVAGKKLSFSPIKSFVYDYLQNVSGIASFFSKRLDFSLSEWRSREPGIFASIKEGTPYDFTEGSTAKYIGKFSGRRSKIPSKVRTPLVSSIPFWDSSWLPEQYRKDATKYVLVTGGFNSNQQHLANFTKGKFLKPDGSPKRYMIKQLFEVVKRFKGTIPSFSIPLPGRSWFVGYKPKAGAGGDTSLYFGDTNSAYSSANATANIINNRLRKADVVPNTIWTLGARNRVNTIKEEGQILQSRVIMQEDKVMFCLQKPWAELVENWLFSEYDQPIQIGKSLSEWNLEMIYGRRKEYSVL
jgi:hypothetical protein